MAKTTKKKATKKTKKPVGCKCLAACQKELKKDNIELVTGFGIDFEAGKSFTTGPFLSVKKIEKSRKTLPSIHCTYCPFCGKKK